MKRRRKRGNEEEEEHGMEEEEDGARNRRWPIALSGWLSQNENGIKTFLKKNKEKSGKRQGERNRVE